MIFERTRQRHTQCQQGVPEFEKQNGAAEQTLI